MSMESAHGRAVDPEELLLRTDWSSVEHCCPNVAPATPAILRQLLDDDARNQGAALRDLQHAVTHQNTFYSATAPAASFVAAILGHPRTLAIVTDKRRGEASHSAEEPGFFLRVGLLDWLGSTVEDANEESPDGYAVDIEAFRVLRPTLFDAIHPFLTDREPEIRRAALASALPLLTSPLLAHHVEPLRKAVRALAADDSPYRRRAIETLARWGEDVTPFRQDVDMQVHAEGCADDPPF
ncbi:MULTISPECIES: hypothetical protein [unclassified Streptomyces]|uniref:hypothetical protein n=1 Tax=Streptomyces TaxID=1883 RepID=UPI0015CDC8FE|nr:MULTISPECIES: hypothetical protein [unclassified Streptomyces]MDN3251075.1 hypothetical protein [Streptomyces sp. ZSW22]MDN3254286.1 hypothetical protein [Streptomyces sp. MA25(2023)]